MHNRRWLALLGWQATALHTGARDCWIGWSSLQRRESQFLIRNQSGLLFPPQTGGIPGFGTTLGFGHNLGAAVDSVGRAATGPDTGEKQGGIREDGGLVNSGRERTSDQGDRVRAGTRSVEEETVAGSRLAEQ